MSELDEITISSREMFCTLAIGCIACIWLGGFLGTIRGRAEQKKLDEAECAAHPKVVYDYNPDGLPQESSRDKCHDLGGLMTDDGHCNFVDSFIPSRKHSKAREPRSDEDYLRGYHDATNYCVASIKKLFSPAPMPSSGSWVCAGDVATCQKLAEAPKP